MESTRKSEPRSEWTRASIIAAFGCWIGYLVGPNVMIASTNSNFMVELPDALGVGTGILTTVLGLNAWAIAILVPISGRMMDRFGVRRIIVPGVFLLGVTFLLLSRMTSLWEFFLLQLMLAIPASMHCSVGYAKIIALWFDRNRGKVLGLCVALGAGVGQTIMPHLSDAVIREFGWRGGYLFLGAILLLFGLPIIALFARTPAKLLARIPAKTVPAANAAVESEAVAAGNPTPAQAEHDRVNEQGLTPRQALRTPTFYLIFIAIMFASMSLLGTLVMAKPMLLERGLPNDLAVTVSSIAFAGVILGELSAGIIVDKFNTPRVVLPYFVSALIGLAIVHTASDPIILCTGALLMGLGLGGEIGQNAYLVSRYFGLKSFGSIYGLTFAASNLGIGIGVMAMGWTKDLTGTFEPMRYAFAATMLVSVLCIAALPKFTFAPRHRG